MNDFVKERNEALFSLDKDRIISYCNKYHVEIEANEKIFWAGVHKAILAIRSATQEQKDNSKKWLLEHGFKPI